MRYGTEVGAALLLVTCFFSGASYAQTPNLKEIHKEAKTGEYVAPYEEDLWQAQQLFHRTLTESWSDDLRTAWSSLGFEFFEHQEDGDTFGVLREQVELRAGRGLYVFRKNTPNGNLLQIPHGYFDLYTGTLGVKLMLAGNFRAAAWNTVPRAETDLAHTEASHFNALTRAFGSLPSAGNTVQIHGFAQGKRETLAGEQADIIVSNGTKMSNESLETLDDCLGLGTGHTVYSYPEEVQELGGTTNSQAKALRLLGNQGFWHVEMSYPFRKAASRSPTLRDALVSCLATD